MALMTTPKEINEKVRAFCRTIDPTQEPVRVKVQAEAGAKFDNCYLTVAEKQKRDQGGIQHGWIIWEWEGTLLEAEFHAVWVPPGGGLLDVSPKADGETEIVFLPDSQRVWQNRSVPSCRMPLREDAVLRDYISAATEYDGLKEKYSDTTGLPQIPMHLLVPVQTRLSAAYQKLGGKVEMPPLATLENTRVKRRELSPRERAEERKRQRRKDKRKLDK